MLMLRVLTAKFDYAAAEVSDSNNLYRVEYNPYQENFFLVYDEAGSVIESYLRLEDCVYSRFSGIFLSLQKAMNACNMVYGTDILSEITSSKTFAVENGRRIVCNRFTYRGKQYLARAVQDESSEITTYEYSVSDSSRLKEENYQALYQAINSVFYPVLADLSHDFEKNFLFEPAESFC